MILIKKMQAPPELESLKKEAEKLGCQIKRVRKIKKSTEITGAGISCERARTSLRLLYA